MATPEDSAYPGPEDFLHRTTLLLGSDAIAALRGKTVAIAGCGGAGAAAAVLLARMGVGAFVLADPGSFDPPDINRQWAATTSTLGRNKAEVYAELLRDINPRASVRTFTQGVTDETLLDILAPADAVVDCLDLKVPLPLRVRFYQEAQRQGLFCISAPIIGTGTLVMMASPSGMPLDGLVTTMVEQAMATSRLPAGFRRYFVEEHVIALERNIARGMAASLAIAPALAGSLIAAELLLVLLRDVFPHWRQPTTLPRVVVADPLLSSYQTLHYSELFGGKVSADDGLAQPAQRSIATPTQHASEQRRRELLHEAGYNTVALGHDAVDLDLLTDSWNDAPPDGEAPAPHPRTTDEVEAVLKRLFPYAHIEPVPRGRFAEALLAELLVRPGCRVLTNGLFPTALHHLASRGARLVYVGPASALGRSANGDPAVAFADVALAALEQELARGDVAAIYVELCNNALGGLPVAGANLRDVHRRARAHNVPVVLDASRAYTNAAQLRAVASSDSALSAIVAEFAKSSDACTASLTKDFASPVGGMVAVNDDGLARRLRQLSRVYYGVRPSARELGGLHDALRLSEDDVAGRVADTFALAHALADLGVPVVRSPGSHAVFVDARGFLSHLQADAHPDFALAAELYAVAGIRVAVNLTTAEQRQAGIAMVRLALRTRTHSRARHEAIVEAFRKLHSRRNLLRGLRGAGLGDVGLERFEPV